MEFEVDPEIERWLQTTWDGTLDWDRGNLEKLVKHQVTEAAITALFLDYPWIFRGRVVSQREFSWWPENRYQLLGETPDGRTFGVIWTPRGSKIRPISCRRMRDGEREIYEREKPGRN